MNTHDAHDELPKFVGYAEIFKRTGMGKRQIQRLMAAGKFPRPAALPTKKNRWLKAAVEGWLEKV